MSQALATPARGAEAPASRAEATRARIEEAAERLFRSMGYQKTAVADIARELGMSPANIYRFYPSKSAINEAIAERMLGGMRAEIEGIAAGPDPAPDRLRRLFSALFELKLALFFGERRLHDMVTAAMQEHWAVIERYLQTVEACIAAVIADGQAAGLFDPALDPVRAGRTAMHCMIAWNHPALVESCIVQRGQTPEELRTQVAEMTEFVLRALRP
jgi:AcrR family transcriptional regulator